MEGLLNNFFEINKVFILGAGFSYPMGLPLTFDLLPLIHSQASRMRYGNEPWGQAERLLNELKYYFPLYNFSHGKIQNGKFNKKVNIEEFLSFTSAESSFLHHGDQLTQHGSYFISFCKKWIGEIIISQQNKAFQQIPGFYHKFVNNLKNSMILTFNWDTVLEWKFRTILTPNSGGF